MSFLYPQGQTLPLLLRWLLLKQHPLQVPDVPLPSTLPPHFSALQKAPRRTRTILNHILPWLGGFLLREREWKYWKYTQSESMRKWTNERMGTWWHHWGRRGKGAEWNQKTGNINTKIYILLLILLLLNSLLRSLVKASSYHVKHIRPAVQNIKNRNEIGGSTRRTRITSCIANFHTNLVLERRSNVINDDLVTLLVLKATVEDNDGDDQ